MRRALGVLLAMAWPWGGAGAHSPVERHTYGLSGWTMEIEQDHFTLQRRCRLFKTLRASGRMISYTRNGVGFPFSENVDTLEAWYRLDGGAPHRARDDYPALIQSGVPIETADIENPTGGLVWIPAQTLGNARTVVIRPNAKGQLVKFEVAGFQAARQAAVDNGCSPDGVFRP